MSRPFLLTAFLLILSLSLACSATPSLLPSDTPTSPPAASLPSATPTSPPADRPSSTPAALPTVAPSPTPNTSNTPSTANPACLVRSWTMSAEQINAKLTQLIALPEGATMPQAQPGSSMTLTFQADGNWTMTGEVTLRGEMPDGFIEGVASYAFDGRHSAEGDLLTIISANRNITITNLRATINGNTIEIPLTSNPFPPEAFDLPSSAQYRCQPDSLQFIYTGPAGPVTETWLPAR